MPIVNYTQYCEMLDRAHRERFAYPAINISTIDTVNAAIEGLAKVKSDGIVQASIGAGTHSSGDLGDSILGSITLAEHAHRAAERYDCTTDHIDDFLEPLIAETSRRRSKGQPNLFS